MMSGFLVLSYYIIVERGLIRCKRCLFVKKVKILYQLNWGVAGRGHSPPWIIASIPPFYVVSTQPVSRSTLTYVLLICHPSRHATVH